MGYLDDGAVIELAALYDLTIGYDEHNETYLVLLHDDVGNLLIRDYIDDLPLYQSLRVLLEGWIDTSLASEDVYLQRTDQYISETCIGLLEALDKAIEEY